jgi:hypothetical protein
MKQLIYVHKFGPVIGGIGSGVMRVTYSLLGGGRSYIDQIQMTVVVEAVANGADYLVLPFRLLLRPRGRNLYALRKPNSLFLPVVSAALSECSDAP